MSNIYLPSVLCLSSANSIRSLCDLWSILQGWSYLLWRNVPRLQVRGSCMAGSFVSSVVYYVRAHNDERKGADALVYIQWLDLQNKDARSLKWDPSFILYFLTNACCSSPTNVLREKSLTWKAVLLLELFSRIKALLCSKSRSKIKARGCNSDSFLPIDFNDSYKYSF